MILVSGRPTRPSPRKREGEPPEEAPVVRCPCCHRYQRMVWVDGRYRVAVHDRPRSEVYCSGRDYCPGTFKQAERP